METHTEDSSIPTKPMILISAKDFTSASAFITELTEDTAVKSNAEETNRRQWQIVNKYYRVDVEIYVLADSEQCPQELVEHVEAHIIFIADNEDGAALAERRWERARGAGARAAVRLLLLDAPAAAPAPAAWARRRRYELVPLRERADDDPECDPQCDPAAPFPETYGAERARAALHAHAWRGLRRLDRLARPPPAAPAPALEPTSSDDDYEGFEDTDDEAAVERAEAFVEALGALGDARAADTLAPDERRRRAERLVAAFCRALGADLPAL